MTIICAKYALNKTGWIEDATITINAEGRIASVEKKLQKQSDYTADILLPAPVNAHSHAFQRAMAGLTEQRGPSPHDSFWTWRKLMYRFLDQLTPEHVEDITAFVQMEMLEAGYATNVEFHYLHHQIGGIPYGSFAEMSARIVNASEKSGIGLTLLPVHYQYGGLDKRPLSAGQIRFGNDLTQFSRLYEEAKQALTRLHQDCRMGLAPHSLRAVAPKDLPDLFSLTDGPVHMHLAEQVAEVDEVKSALGLRPVEYVLENLNLNSNFCFIHCTQMQPHETEGLAHSGAVVGLCPITESSLGDGIFDCTRWLDNRGNMAIGSDSNIRISLSEELRTLEYSQRLRDRKRAVLATEGKSTGRRLFSDICQGGAMAAGRDCGEIAIGKYADLIALSGNHVDLHEKQGDTLLDSYIFAGDDRMITDVWSAGRHLVKEGVHINRQEIEKAYKTTMTQLRKSI